MVDNTACKMNLHCWVATHIIISYLTIDPSFKKQLRTRKTTGKSKPTYMSSALPAPLHQSERIWLIDSIRGIALLGILLMNSMAQSQSHFFGDRMDPRQSLTGANFFAVVTESIFFEGTMRGLFSILFGAGTILLLTRLTNTRSGLEPADIYFRRMLWLLVFGLIDAFLFLWFGDILYAYALCGLLLFPFRNLS